MGARDRGGTRLLPPPAYLTGAKDFNNYARMGESLGTRLVYKYTWCTCKKTLLSSGLHVLDGIDKYTLITLTNDVSCVCVVNL